MRRLHYHLVDVFTGKAFGGNQLAVFTGAEGLSAGLMQSIARELNLSETTFVLPPLDAESDYRLRIFTPAVELPMAGHPTVGTSFVLAREGMIRRSGDEATVRLEEGVGVIRVRIRFRNDLPDFIEMSQPLPVFGPRFADAALLAEMLSLETQAIIGTGLPLEVVSCGVPFLFVPLTDLRAVRAIRFRLDVWERALRDFAAPQVFAFTTETEVEGSSVHGRMFAPAMGISEDPATGAASGPLGCYLARHGVFPPARLAELTSEQGFEMGRPSFVKIVVEQESSEITGVRVGGQCYAMGQGYFELDENLF
ncbi:MAG TPA: PhzF family phenazine biosynthesis protein [Pyrinomonadaceae bacterium]|jgi:trans-2,3-dihydro-3-hydroxyanthranilate isomerase